MFLLASQIEGAIGGVPMLNQLILAAARRGKLRGSVVAFVDTPDATWRQAWPDNTCAGGSRARFLAGAMRRAVAHRGTAIFVSHLGIAPVGRLAKMVSGGPLVVMLLGAEALVPLSRDVRWALAGCDLLVSISACTLRGFLERNPEFRTIPARVCHLPARELGDPVPRQESGALRVITVGRLSSRGMEKGQRQLISVWPRIQSRFCGAELWIVGGGDGQAELKQLASAAGVGSVVRFPGSVPDNELAALYDSADVFAMPSRFEGFGLVFAEAMSRGLPCIASRIDAGAEVVDEGQTGLLVHPDDLDEIHNAIATLLADRVLRERMGSAGRERARALFSRDDFDRRMQALLSGRIAPPAPAGSKT